METEEQKHIGMNVKNRTNSEFSEEELELLDFSKNTKLIDQHQIGNTPFNMVLTDEGNFIALGTKRITGKLTETEAEDKANEIIRNDWKFLCSVIAIITKEAVAQHHLEIMAWEAKNQTNNNQ